MSKIPNTVFQRTILGAEVKDSIAFGAKNGLCETYSFVRNGHEECGDSSFVYMDDNKVLVGIFDGVSTENGVQASARAALLTLDDLRKGEPSEKRIVDALTEANNFMNDGMTTAVVACFDESGRYFLGSIGDSPIYMRQHEQIQMMMTLDKVVKPGQDVPEFERMREYITGALGDPPLETIHTQTGVASSGAVFLLCTDGLSDNLATPFYRDPDGVPRVQNTNDTSDLSKIIRHLQKPQSIVTRLIETVDERIGTEEEHLWLDSTRLVIPSTDDVAAIALRWL